MNNEKYENLRTELYKQADGKKALYLVSDFIVWALESGNHEDIADLFFLEDSKTKKSFATCMEAAKSDARKQAGSASYAMVEDCDVYMSIAKYLGLADCITMDEIKQFASGTLHAPAGDPAPAEPSTKSDGLDLGLDDLFG